MQKSKNLAIFASGRGSNAKNLILSSKTLPNLAVKLLICDQEKAPVLEMAKEHGLEVRVLSKIPKESKADHENRILDVMKEFNIEWVFLAGYMKILGPTILNHFQNRIINIHPSLLPSFPGKDAYRDAFDYGVKVSGVTTHFVDEGIDTGKIILQECFSKNNEDTLETFSQRGLELEYKIYAKTMRLLNDGALETMAMR